MSKVTIEKIEIKNYRLCKNAIFEPNLSLSALIGPNGSGKTTLLKSLMLLQKLTSERLYGHPRYMHKTFMGADPTVLEVYLRLNDRYLVHKAELFLDNDNENNDVILHSQQTWRMSYIDEGKKEISMPIALIDEERSLVDHILATDDKIVVPWGHNPIDVTVLRDKKIRTDLADIFSFYKSFTYYSASKFTNPSLCPISFTNDDGIVSSRRSSSSHLEWLRDMFVEYKKNTNEYQAYISVVGKEGIGLIDEIDFEEVESSNIDIAVKVGGRYQKRNKRSQLIIPQIKINKSKLSPSQLSEGTFKTLAMLFYLMTGQSSLMLLEEPEVCIHHGLLASVVDIIQERSAKKQIIVSTHSDFVLDALDESSIYFVQRNNRKGIQCLPLDLYLSNRDKAALKEYLRFDGSLGQYWRMGGFDA